MNRLMRGQIVAVVVAVGLLFGCGLEDPSELDPGSVAEPIIGGTTAPFDDAVVMVELQGGLCSGTLIRPNVVLTAGHCTPAVRVDFGQSLQSITASRRVVDTFTSRRYDAGIYAGGDIQLLELASDAPSTITPLPINDVRPLTQDDVGATIRLVGFGNTDGVAGTGAGTRRQVNTTILGVNDSFITFGDDIANTCQGDSGGPAFLNMDGSEHVIAVTSFGQAGCLEASDDTRVDIYLDEFINEIIDAWTGPCKLDGTCTTTCPGFPDPDCGECGYDHFCSTGCDKKDLDCPLSGGPGALCGNREDCESLTCITAQDDPRVSYCSQECDPATNAGCESPITVCQSDSQGNYCRYPGATPSTQGTSCMTGDDCRSKMCDTSSHMCVEPCGDGQPACADGFTCQSLEGTQVCRLPKKGGCQTGSTPGTMVLIAMAGLLGLLGLRRRNA